MKLSWVTLARGDDHGYAVVSKELCLAVEKAGATFLEPWTFGADLTVVFALPSTFFFQDGRPRRDIVWHTMIEVEPMPPEWVPVLNLCGAVWAPSQWVADTFRRQGVTVPIFVSGYGTSPRVHYPRWALNGHDPALLASTGSAGSRGDGLRVGVWGDSFGSRKRVLAAVEAFLAAGLPDDATLEVKVNAPRPLTPQKLTMHGQEVSTVQIFNQSWSITQLTDWLRSLDVLIYMSGGEGYGLMPLEAMACGVPVISGLHTGMLDYLTPDNCLPVPCDNMTEAPSYDYRFGYKAYMRECDSAAVTQRLRWAYTHRDELAALGRVAQQSVAHLTWERAGVRALKFLRDIAENNYPHDLGLSLSLDIDDKSPSLVDADALGGKGRASQLVRAYASEGHGSPVPVFARPTEWPEGTVPRA